MAAKVEYGEFAGFRLGIAETELRTLLKSKGFKHFVNVDTGEIDGNASTIEEFTMRMESFGKEIDEAKSGESIACFQSRAPSDVPAKNQLLEQHVCSYGKSPTQAIEAMTFQIYEHKLIAMSFSFFDALSSESFSGILGKYGQNAESMPWYSNVEQLKAIIKNREALCREKICDVLGWSENNGADLFAAVLFTGTRAKGNAHVLLVRNSLKFNKMAAKMRTHLDGINKAKTKKLGF